MGLQPADVTRILQAGLPVLCLDTCSILDILRDPTRDTAQPSDLAVALDLLDRIENQKTLVALACDQVRQEFQEHVVNIQEESKKALDKFRERIERVNTIAAQFGANGALATSHWDNHPQLARSAADRLINVAEHVPQSADIPSRAHRRSVLAQPPSKKGKGSPGDCAIIETYFETVGRLRSSGLSSKVVFLSSNTADYCANGKLHTALQAEFAPLLMEYAPNFGAARHLLGL
ncbi:PIN domain-containing protein [Dokdonella sp.]|uniref:PIN domain-containing protein n=1 Tax=Dokdonella sp. TaxID=2291710 RepID=UPI00321FB529